MTHVEAVKPDWVQGTAPRGDSFASDAGSPRIADVLHEQLDAAQRTLAEYHRRAWEAAKRHQDADCQLRAEVLSLRAENARLEARLASVEGQQGQGGGGRAGGTPLPTAGGGPVPAPPASGGLEVPMALVGRDWSLDEAATLTALAGVERRLDEEHSVCHKDLPPSANRSESTSCSAERDVQANVVPSTEPLVAELAPELQHPVPNASPKTPAEEVKSENPGLRKLANVFPQPDMMKQELKEQMMLPTTVDYYHDSGIFQAIAKSQAFEYATLAVISLNALWIAVDTDYNDQDVLLKADPIFQLADNFFCTYFAFETVVRFMSFRCKRDCLKDSWFVFDGTLACLMVLDTWVLTLVMLVGSGSNAAVGNVAFLRILRLLRLVRMARLARLMRAVPELMILAKGMLVATRIVVCSLSLLCLVMYVFAIMFTQLTKDSHEVHSQYFGSVRDSMASLFLGGVMPDQESILTALGSTSVLYVTLMLLFILLAALTVMNMLMGMLVEVVSCVSQVEKQRVEMMFVKDSLKSVWDDARAGWGGKDEEERISKQEFGLLIRNPAAVAALQGIGVDVIGLVDFTDYLFEEESSMLSFPDFLELLLELRGSNGATVKDIAQLRKMIKSGFVDFTRRMPSLIETVLWQQVAEKRHGPSVSTIDLSVMKQQ